MQPHVATTTKWLDLWNGSENKTRILALNISLKTKLCVNKWARETALCVNLLLYTCCMFHCHEKSNKNLIVLTRRCKEGRWPFRGPFSVIKWSFIGTDLLLKPVPLPVTCAPFARCGVQIFTEVSMNSNHPLPRAFPRHGVHTKVTKLEGYAGRVRWQTSPACCIFTERPVLG